MINVYDSSSIQSKDSMSVVNADARGINGKRDSCNTNVVNYDGPEENEPRNGRRAEQYHRN